MRSGQGAKFNFSFVKLEKDHCEGRWARGAPWGLKPSREGSVLDSTHLAAGHLFLLFTSLGRWGLGDGGVWCWDAVKNFWRSVPSPSCLVS